MKGFPCIACAGLELLDPSNIVSFIFSHGNGQEGTGFITTTFSVLGNDSDNCHLCCEFSFSVMTLALTGERTWAKRLTSIKIIEN